MLAVTEQTHIIYLHQVYEIGKMSYLSIIFLLPSPYALNLVNQKIQCTMLVLDQGNKNFVFLKIHQIFENGFSTSWGLTEPKRNS